MAPEGPFTGKIALVTGSGRGIGRAIALNFAQQGASVAVNFFRNRRPAMEVVEEIRAMGSQAEAIRANVGELDQIDFLISEVQRLFGGLDILISNAASGYNRPVMEQKEKGWEWTMDINAKALLFLAQKAAPIMEARGGGSIVSISSPGSTKVLPEYVMVGASKAALEAITRYLAVELAPQKIVVNAVSPGVVQTEALQYFDLLKDDNLFTQAAAHTPAGRLACPEDVAGLVAFLCSPAAEMIRGQVIVMDGGLSLYYLPNPNQPSASLPKS
jgi:enoyl-[acyl-carrier protein] reductase III